MSGSATGLDHVGVAVPELGAAAVEWQALGFTVQKLAAHMAGGAPTGTGNRNIMLRHGYIELLATIDPARPSATLARFLARHIGIHVLTLAMEDEAAALARLGRAGFAASLAHSSRPADPDAPEGPQAEFARIPLADADPRLQLLRQVTPELVWQERFLTHANRAAALQGVVVAADPPAEFAARLARAAGLPLSPDPAGGYALALPSATIRIVPPGAAAALLAGAALPVLPCIAGLVVRTDDGNAAVRGLAGGVVRGDGTVVARASGVTVVFTP